ncbi:MAG: protein translocase subunit SecF [Alphaproteobacteria bacterium]|nr:protein translocase subunit SecF [Alphaproteobacteria bacterium]
MKTIRLVPSQTRFPFMVFRYYAYALSCMSLLASFLFFGFSGLNYGIDFRGGVLLEVQSLSPRADLLELRSRLSGLNLGEIELQEFGVPSDVLIRVELQQGGDDAQQAAIIGIKDALGEMVTYRRIEVVGPKVSRELIRRGAISVLVSLIAVLIYIWCRFEWQFAIGAIVATLHDVLLTLGLFSFLQIEFGLPIIAAILTIVGYSLNDTVVVFDRVRENLRRYKKMPLSELLELSINQTLSRTVLTSFTTLIALFSLYFLGGEVIRGFTFAMILGIFIGTYSSVFVAVPLLLILNLDQNRKISGD